MLKCNCGWNGINLKPNFVKRTSHCPSCGAIAEGITALYAKVMSLELEKRIRDSMPASVLLPIENHSERVTKLNGISPAKRQCFGLHFRLGDKVEVFLQGKWEPGIILKPFQGHSSDEVSVRCQENVGSKIAKGHGLIVGVCCSDIRHLDSSHPKP